MFKFIKRQNFVVFSILLLVSAHSQAILIGGQEFPQGNISFADSVVDFSPTVLSGDPETPYLGDFNALGLPDYVGDNTCASQAECSFVSLGDGGSIVLQFIDNVLT
jgi:hypothetical protein